MAMVPGVSGASRNNVFVRLQEDSFSVAVITVIMSDKPFLSHIGGLRGIAILLVILFHLCPAVFPNCYYGVDIFLVITGYLLFLGMDRNDGSWRSTGLFAFKKVQRILPAVSVAVLLTVLAGIYFLDKTMLEATARLGRYTLFGMANNHLNKVVSNYFDSTAALNPLLHMWYIGITLQVYLLFAFGVMLCRRVSRKVSMRSLAVIGLLSLGWKYRMELLGLLSCVGVSSDAISPPTHYDTLPRLWEILAGGMIFMLPSVRCKWVQGLMVLVGLAGISTAFYLAQAEVLAVLGTMLIIRYAGGSKVECLLSNRPLLWIGAISFSLYLVHMPVFVFYKGWIVVPPTMGEYAAMLGITAVLGVLFWLLVEKRRISWKVWVPVYVFTMVLCIMAKKTTVIHELVAGEQEEIVVKPYEDWQFITPDSELMRGYAFEHMGYWGGVFQMADTERPAGMPETALLLVGDAQASRPCFVLMGDSHAASMCPGIDVLCRKHEISGLYLPTVVSPFWNYEIQRDRHGYFCDRNKMMALLDWLKVQPHLEYVVVVQRWCQRCQVNKYDWDKKPADLSMPAHTEAIRQFSRRLAEIGKKLILMDQIPDFETNPRTYAKWCIRHNRNPEERLQPFLCSRERYQTRHRDYLQMLETLRQEGACQVISFNRTLNADGNYVSYAGGEVLYRDDNHPTAPGAIWMMEQIGPEFVELVKPGETASE